MQGEADMRKLIRWEEIKEDWVTLDSTTIPRYGKHLWAFAHPRNMKTSF